MKTFKRKAHDRQVFSHKHLFELIVNQNRGENRRISQDLGDLDENATLSIRQGQVDKEHAGMGSSDEVKIGIIITWRDQHWTRKSTEVAILCVPENALI